MKGIIVVDIPEHCTLCRYSYISEKNTQWVCGIKNKRIDGQKSKMDWCPIKFIPDKKEVKNAENMTSLGWIEGWNACIDEIEGKQ